MEVLNSPGNEATKTMKSYEHYRQMGAEPGPNLMRLVDELISSEDGARVSFDRVKIEGGNVGASMHVYQGNPSRQTEPAEQPGCPSINIYISNNIQGVSSSILVGSEVKMADPGLGLSFGDVSWEREARGRGETTMDVVDVRKLSPIFWLNALAVLVCGFVLVLSFFSVLARN